MVNRNEGQPEPFAFQQCADFAPGCRRDRDGVEREFPGMIFAGKGKPDLAEKDGVTSEAHHAVVHRLPGFDGLLRCELEFQNGRFRFRLLNL